MSASISTPPPIRCRWFPRRDRHRASRCGGSRCDQEQRLYLDGGAVLDDALDATLVHGLLVPAVMRLAGNTNWWVPAPPRSTAADPR